MMRWRLSTMVPSQSKMTALIMAGSIQVGWAAPLPEDAGASPPVLVVLGARSALCGMTTRGGASRLGTDQERLRGCFDARLVRGAATSCHATEGGSRAEDD